MQKGLNGSGSRVWYRRVHRELLHKSFVVRKHVVRLFVKDLDSEDVMLRRTRRRRRRRRRREEVYADVNTVILDLAPHIISMNMRSWNTMALASKMYWRLFQTLWLNVGASNKDQNVAAKLYLDTSEFGGAAKYISADDGTEYSIIEPMNIYLSSLDSGMKKVTFWNHSKQFPRPKINELNHIGLVLEEIKQDGGKRVLKTWMI